MLEYDSMPEMQSVAVSDSHPNLSTAPLHIGMVVVVAVTVVTVVAVAVVVVAVAVVAVPVLVVVVVPVAVVVDDVVVGSGQLSHLTGHAARAALRMSAFGLPHERSLTKLLQPTGSSLSRHRAVVVVAVADVAVADVAVADVVVAVLVVAVLVLVIVTVVAVLVVVLVVGHTLHITLHASRTVTPSTGLVHMLTCKLGQFESSGKPLHVGVGVVLEMAVMEVSVTVVVTVAVVPVAVVVLVVGAHEPQRIGQATLIGFMIIVLLQRSGETSHTSTGSGPPLQIGVDVVAVAVVDVPVAVAVVVVTVVVVAVAVVTVVVVVAVVVVVVDGQLLHKAGHAWKKSVLTKQKAFRS